MGSWEQADGTLAILIPCLRRVCISWARCAKKNLRLFGRCVDVRVFEKDVVAGGMSVKFINLSDTEVLDWFDDELFRRVKDRLTGGEFVAMVLSSPSLHSAEHFVVHWIRRAWFEGTPAG